MKPDDQDSTDSDRLAGHRHPRETNGFVGHAAAEADLLECLPNRAPAPCLADRRP